jgi:plasmid stabilization system protein ParE
MSVTQGQALPVVYAPVALQELDVIWDWNEKNYSRSHAARYVDFLEHHIDALSENHQRGKVVESRPEYRYIIIRRKAKGHGHVAVYRFDDKGVNVLHVFHTAQDWQAILSEETPSQ